MERELMPARRFTDEQELEICRRYEAGENIGELGKAFEVNPATAWNILKRNSVERRSISESRGGLKPDQDAEVCRRYEAGGSTRELGKTFGVSKSTIGKILERNRVEKRSSSEALRGLTPEQEAEVCHRYEAGENSPELGKTFGMAKCTIREILKRNGVKRRTKSEAQRCLKPQQETEICRRYEAGESSIELGKAFEVNKCTISEILKRNGVKRRSISEAMRYLPPEQELEICSRYQARENTVELGKAFGVNSSTIGKILERNGVKRRTSGEAQRCLNPDQEPEVCRRYEAGENTIELGKAFGVTDSAISSILKRNDVEMRSYLGATDSVQHVLDGTGRHTYARECEFYLYELARYSDTHCKPGIAFDADLRADEEYGDETLRLLFSTRAEALFLEQAVQDVTRGSAQCPQDLLGWIGATEVRAIPASDLEPIVLHFADEMEELGVWEFAAHYVPMTAAQRAICQQRGAKRSGLDQ